MVDRDALKRQVCDEVDRRADLLLDASHRIHADPELGFEEHHAHDLLTSILADAGLDTERGAFDVPTAFQAPAGSGDGPVVAVLCEYDALPDIGHACGHNVIATAGLGAALAAATVADAAGGRLAVFGTPAEEGGGGKILMARRGAFDGVDAALMVHPADADLLTMSTIAIQQLAGGVRGTVGPRRRLPVGGPQRPRRRRARLRERGRPAPAHRADRAHPRHLHQGRRAAQHRAPGDGRPLVRALAHDGVARGAEGPGADVPRGRGAGGRLHR